MRATRAVSQFRHAAAVGAALLAILGGAACDGVVKQAEEAVTGNPQVDGGRLALIVQPAAAGDEQLLVDVRPVISDAARRGARVRVFVLSGGSAAAMREIRLSDEAGGGDFTPQGRNTNAWQASAEHFEEAAMADLVPALEPDQTLEPTGADLIGAVRRGISIVQAMAGSGPFKVVLVAGAGGVQRSVEVDLVAPVPVTTANAADLARLVPVIDAGTVSVEIIGMGRFEGIAVDPRFAEGVTAWWHAVCPACRFK